VEIIISPRRSIFYKAPSFVNFLFPLLPVISVMDFLSDLSPSAHMPVFNVHINDQSVQKLFKQELHDEANRDPFTPSAAGSATSPPLPSTCQPTQPIYTLKQDQLNAFFNTYFFTNPNAGRDSALDSSNPVNDGFQVSSSPSSYVSLVFCALFLSSHRTSQSAPIIFDVPTWRRCIAASYFPGTALLPFT
jgi:hypothetical protein